MLSVTLPLLALGALTGGISVDSIPVAPPMSVSGTFVPLDIGFEVSANVGMHIADAIKNKAKAIPIRFLSRFLSLFRINNMFLPCLF